jgi:hypothetical protein
MADTKQRNDSADPTDSAPSAERRRLSKVVHDDKGNATVQWHDAPADYVRPVFEIEGGVRTQKPANSPLKRDPLTFAAEDTHNPYTRVPDGDRKRDVGNRTDLRKLSAWIKLMRELEDKKRGGGEEG